MKFEEHLFTHRAPEWRTQYISYPEMKALLYNAIKMAPQVVEEEASDIYFRMFEDEFFNFCEKELQKINKFYDEKLREATETLMKLKMDLDIVQMGKSSHKKGKVPPSKMTLSNLYTKIKEKALQLNWTGGQEVKKNKRGEKRVTRLSDLKFVFSEFYLSLVLLKNYQDLNFTGFRKILKKHDKLLNTPSGACWLEDEIQDSEFHVSRQVDRLIKETETVVAEKLEGGNRPRAMKKLRVVPPECQQNPWTIFKIGLFSGALSVLVIVLILTAIYEWSDEEDWPLVFRLYRAPLLVCVFTFFIGVNIYGWRSTGVNHILIFELDPRNPLSEQQLFELATFFGFFWVVSVLSFVYSSSPGSPLNWPAYINPLTLLIILFLIFMINPTKTCSRQARFWFLCVLGRIVSAPFFEVKFPDFWLADQLNSLVQVVLDLQYSICLYGAYRGDFYTSSGNHAERCRTDGGISIWIRSFLACLPAWFRFMQCLRRYKDTREAFPHLANAAKYSTTFFVILCSTFHLVFEGDHHGVILILWVTASLISSTYSLLWDILMDWGLFEKNKINGKRSLLRKEIVYPSPCLYYFAIVQNFVLRFNWAISYSLIHYTSMDVDSMISISALLEMYRRFVWNFFRLENEHLNNCGKFRAVRDISLAHLKHPSHIYRHRQSVIALG